MPRSRVPISFEHPYHLSARCINKEWFKIPMDDVWAVMEAYLYAITVIYDIKIVSFVLMSNHYHLIARAPLGNLSEAMQYFMRETSKRIGKQAGRINQIYGSRYFRSIITSDLHFQYAYKYVYRNPVKGGLTSQVEDYKYSTLPALLGKYKLRIPLTEDYLLFGNGGVEGALSWLNMTPPGEIEEDVRKALRRSTFRFPRIFSGKKTNLEERLLY